MAVPLLLAVPAVVVALVLGPAIVGGWWGESEGERKTPLMIQALQKW